MTIDEATKKLIDSLKQTCGSFGLGNDGNAKNMSLIPR